MLYRVSRLSVRIVAAVFVLALLAGAGRLSVAADDIIRVGTGPDDQATPLLYAAKAGIYKKYGLNVQILKLGGASAVAAAMAGGSLEISKASSLGAITAIGRGLPFTVIGNIAYYDASRPDVALMVPVDSNIKTPKDLEGKTVGVVTLDNLNSVGLFAWLTANHVDLSAVKFTELATSASIAALDRGQIDAAMVYEPYLSAFLAGGKVRVLAYPLGAIAQKFSNAVLFTNTSWAASHGDLVKRFLLASQEASEYIAKHESEATRLIVEFGGLDPASVQNIRHATRGVPVDARYLQPVIDAAATYHVIPKSFAAEQMICSCALIGK